MHIVLYTSKVDQIYLFHGLQMVRNTELCSSLAPDLFDFNARGQFRQK